MKISSQDLVDEFYKWLKENTDSDLSFTEVRDIINAPFSHVKKIISSGLFTPIRLIGFGLFFVQPRKVKYALTDLQKRYQNGNLQYNSYIRYHNVFTKYLQKKENDKTTENIT